MPYYRSITALQRDNAACRRCVEAGHPVESLPVFQGRQGQRAYLLGQAPGAVEGTEGRPWRGRAGATLRRWLRQDEETFSSTFHCASVTRCYPGRALTGRGDRRPAPEERALCRVWREHELRLLRPALVLTVGALAAHELLGVARLADTVGKSFVIGEAVAIPLPHPSGASGWLHDATNRVRLGKALVHARRELARIAGDDAGPVLRRIGP